MNGVAADGGMLEHLQAEHHKLNCRLSAIQHRINDRFPIEAPGYSSSDFVAWFDCLRAELLAHFAEEETDGCLGIATCRCPSAASQLKAITADHEALLRAVNEMVEAVTGNSASADTLARRFEAFAEQLHAHEAAESRLLQYALGGDVADYDVEGNE
jgi:hypothetical protein